MGFRKGENPNHPKKGSAIKVDPIRDLRLIQKIKNLLLTQNKIRDYCLFTLGVNTAWRANELLALRVSHVRHLNVGDILEIKQSKNRKYRKTLLNREVIKALKLWLEIYKPEANHVPLFPSNNTSTALTVPTLTGMVKRWCLEVGANGNYGSHSLRKSWGYHQRMTYEAPLALLVSAFGHSSERQTLDYLGIQPAEISDLFRNEI
jgi:integrase